MHTAKTNFWFFVSLVLIEVSVISINFKLSKNGVNVTKIEKSEVLLMSQPTSGIWNEVTTIYTTNVI